MKDKKIIFHTLFFSILILIYSLLGNIYFSNSEIIVTTTGDTFAIRRIRWDNQSFDYPFIGDDVFQEVSSEASSNSKVYFSVPTQGIKKLRLDFEQENLIATTVELTGIQILTPFKTYNLSPEQIVNSFYGANGAKIHLENNIARITFESSENQFIESMSYTSTITYSRAIFEWILRSLYSISIVFLLFQLKGQLRLYCSRYNIIEPAIITLLYAIILNFYIEAITRRNFYLAVQYMKERTFNFCFSFLIIWLVLLLFSFYKKWALSMFLVSIIFWIFAIGSYFVYSMRGTLVVWQDFKAFKYGLSILNTSLQLKTFHFIVLCVLLIIFIKIILFLNRFKIKNIVTRYILSAILAIDFCLIVVFSSLGTWNNNVTEKNSQLENGCVATLFFSFFNSHIKEPENYSKEVIDSLELKVLSPETAFNPDLPNIIFLQVEAFMDPTTINNLDFSEDPIPNFRKLQEQFGSGTLTVPVYGGSTVNTEFEILTGLPVKWLRNGEYPYLTIASYEPVESLASYFSSNYQTTAIHNWMGDFYNRDYVFSNLGFEEYICRETMTEQIYNNYYMSDEMFSKYIPLVLESSQEKDFIFGITVGMHGPYLSTPLSNDSIRVSGNTSEENLNNLGHYIEALHQFDDVLGRLIDYFESYPEPILLVLYGDHRPALEMFDLATLSNAYEVPYLVYTNYDMDFSPINLYSYQLSSYILDNLGITGGYVNQFHQTYYNSPNYEQYLELLQYDILNGDAFLYDESDLPVASDMELGTLEPVSITDITVNESGFLVKGNNFNLDSEIWVNGKQISTEYIDIHTLQGLSSLEDNSEIKILTKGIYRTLGNEVIYHYTENIQN